MFGSAEITAFGDPARMRGVFLGIIAALCVAVPPVAATGIVETRDVSGGGSVKLPPYLQCVPYARQVTGVRIYGDAYTWWDQAEGRYKRGFVPKVGAVMALLPHGGSHLGHVAAVSRIVDARTILIRHANWSPIGGRRGQIEDNVRAVDVSADNDWSEVRIWFAPIGDLGGSHWPVQGFIYPNKGAKSLTDKVREILPATRITDPIGELIARGLRL